MRHFQVILLVLISFQISSCAFNPRILKFKKNRTEQTSRTAALFNTDGASAVYNTKVDFYKFHFSGLVAIKRNTASNYDVALISEMGMTLIKMKYVNGKYQDVSVLEELNRPVVINLIQDDLAMLMIDEANFKKKWLTQRSNKVDVMKLKKKGTAPYFLYFKNNLVSRIDKAYAVGKKVQITILNYEEQLPTEISLKHFGLKNASLTFKKLIQNEPNSSDKKDEYDIDE